MTAWSPSVNNYYQHLVVELPDVMRLAQLAVQGKQNTNEYVSEFLLQYSTDGDSWMIYNNAGGAEKVWGMLWQLAGRRQIHDELFYLFELKCFSHIFLSYVSFYCQRY